MVDQLCTIITLCAHHICMQGCVHTKAMPASSLAMLEMVTRTAAAINYSSFKSFFHTQIGIMMSSFNIVHRAQGVTVLQNRSSSRSRKCLR